MCYCCIQGCSTVPIKNCYQQFLQHSRKRDQLTGVLAGVRAGGRAGMLLLPYTSLAPQLNLARSAAAERPALNRVRAGTRGACTALRDTYARGSELRRRPRGDTQKPRRSTDAPLVWRCLGL